MAIECPSPWASDDMESKGIPDNLRELSQELYDDYDRFQTRFLLIHNEHASESRSSVVLSQAIGIIEGIHQAGISPDGD